MSTARNTTVQVGPSGATVLTIVFVLLKVFGYINWSWIWVFAPMWLGLAIVLGVLAFIGVGAAILFILAAIADLFTKRRSRKF